jgi:hypothetical protein
MADSTNPKTSGPLPPLPSSGMTGRLANPTTHLPVKKGGPGKIVVMLSSVAKAAPAGTQALPSVAPAKALLRPPPLPVQQSPAENAQMRLSATTHVKFPTKATAPVPTPVIAAAPPKIVPQSKEPVTASPTPPPLPAVQVPAEDPQLRLTTTTHIKFPPKATAPIPLPAVVSVPPKIVPGKEPSGIQAVPPPLPGRSKKHTGAIHLSPIKLNEPAAENESTDSLFLSPQAPPTATPVVKTPQPILPPPLPPVKPAESAPLHVAPPMLEKESEASAEKLPQPHFTTEAKADPAPTTPAPEASALHKVPALVEPEPHPGDKPLHALPGKALPPPVIPGAKILEAGNPVAKSLPIVPTPGSPNSVSKKIEVKSTLKPAVLPKRTLAISLAKETEQQTPPPISETTEKSALPGAVTASPVAALAAKASEPATPGVEEVEPPPPTLPLASFPKMASTPKAPLPPTRAARSKKRRVWELVAFYLIFAVTIVLLFFGSLYFGRQTRVEGQVIPPTGTLLNNEVWIVSDFRELSSGIAEDLAAERTPLMQEIQERQDHVARAQADVASREERIRLIQQEIDTTKTEMATIGKQAREATQQVWDGEGGEIQSDYQSRMDGLKRTIADRAKSLNLKYEPDETYQSPEVWANAYRLALYETPPGVDGVKEHQWLSDQMTQWRTYVKTLDTRKEQLRDKAAQIKSATGPKETDLQSKIDDLQHRADATATEEVPLKAELQQAQGDLAVAQTADTGLDDKYYKQLDALPQEAISKRIPMLPNGRFGFDVEENAFAGGEQQQHYWLFARATRADGRQYWALYHLGIARNQTVELNMEPTAFVSTKAILRPNLSPADSDQ